MRAYNRSGFLERVNAAGFSVREYGRNEFGRFAFWRHGIHRRSILYVVQKRRTERP